MKTGIEKWVKDETVLKKEHKDALLKHYKDNGVGVARQKRLDFWEDEKCFMSQPS